jgi:hypothetical protein
MSEAAGSVILALQSVSVAAQLRWAKSDELLPANHFRLGTCRCTFRPTIGQQNFGDHAKQRQSWMLPHAVGAKLGSAPAPLLGWKGAAGVLGLAVCA